MSLLHTICNKNFVYKERGTVYHTLGWIRVKIDREWVEYITYHPQEDPTVVYGRTYEDFMAKFVEMK